MPIRFDHFVIVMLENASRSLVLQNSYMSSLLSQGVFLRNANGLTHPSQPNYTASTGGDTFGINGDDPFWVAPYVTSLDPNREPPVTSIVDLLEAKGLTWKAYAENIQSVDINQPPSPLFQPPEDPVYPPIGPQPSPESSPLFARRHVPFLSYPSVVTNPQRVANIVNAQAEFESDLAAGQLPHYTWYSPNLVNNGHSIQESDGTLIKAPPSAKNIDDIATFLQGFLGPDPLTKFPPRTLIAITFDESFPYSDYGIYTLLIGDQLEAASSRIEPYGHYSLLRSVEDNFGIGNDFTATPYWFLALD